MNKVFGIVGWSGSGKTDLTTRIISLLFTKKDNCFINKAYSSRL